MTSQQKRPVVLIIRDGWGNNPYPEFQHANAVHLAKTPVDDWLPGKTIRTSKSIPPAKMSVYPRVSSATVKLGIRTSEQDAS